MFGDGCSLSIPISANGRPKQVAYLKTEQMELTVSAINHPKET